MFQLFLVFASLIPLSQSQSVSEYPIWPVTCSFSRYEGKTPRATGYTASSTATQDGCEGECEGDPHCGLYGWSTKSGLCERFQTSVMTWEEVGLNVGDLWWTISYYRSGSKLCKGEYLPTTCNEYEYTDRKGPPFSGFITYVWTDTPTSSLTPDTCKHLCDLYSECESVRYFVGYCNLYKTSLADGVVECPWDFSLCGTYERRCASTTNPPPTTTSVPPTAECPTDLSLYHGGELCLPLGLSPDECEALPGCCYVQVASTGWCIRPN